MSVASASVVQYGRRKGSSREVTSAEVNNKPNLPVDLREVTVLPKSEWRRIQDSVNRVNKQHERLIAAARQREAMHLHSKEVVKNWSNTIAGQWQKKLEAKKIREEIEEEERKQIDIEEAKFQEQKRKDAIERAKTLQYYQIDRVKGFHSALLMTEVLKEREAQIELKKRKEKASKDVDKEILAVITRKEALALQQEWLKALEKKQKALAVAESLKQQIKEHEQAREEEIMEQKEEAEDVKRVHELFIKEQTTHEQKKQEEKRNIMKAYQEHLANKKSIQAAETEKQESEEERRKLFVKAKGKMMNLRKEKEAEMLREVERHREAVFEKLSTYHQEQTKNEEERISKAAAEAEAKQDKQQREKDEKKAAMLKSISEHREAVQKELEYKKQEEKQKAIEMLNAKKASDIIFLQKQLLKAQKMKEAGKMLQDTYVQQMAEKHAQEQHMKNQEQEFEAKNAELIAEDENQFQNYAKHVIQKASEAQRNTSLLRKATKEGIGGGLGPVFRGIRPSYLVQDQSGVQLPSYACSTTQGIKELNETTDFQKSKKRLGFTW
ncbi:cilia- and flagella- associated protein 210 [Pangasianodon hypophthalmus]|uniref:cilia- and flagella- associated protein 210 n=1 Tax=Pangasianodon hypophthalmus TaxID=310915 RepID=UPI002307B73C|nr:cilia- and flagella- associated protein 210 [Pangasianodon hypophthalmus]